MSHYLVPGQGGLESVRIHFLPILEEIGKCQNWKVSELESVRIGKSQNWKVSELESQLVNSEACFWA